MKKESAIRLEEILDLRKEEIRESCCWTFSMYDENGEPIEPTDEDIERYVERRYQTFLALEGPERLFNCRESYNAISLKSELEEIRYSDKEQVLLLAVIGDRIADKLVFEGKEGHIDLLDYSNNGAFDFIRKWKEKGASILNYHNHPISVAARPSKQDMINLSINTDLNDYFNSTIGSISRDTLNEIKTKHLNLLESNGLTDFCFDDWGVVTEFDFFSSTQKHDMLIDLFEETEKEMHKLITNT